MVKVYRQQGIKLDSVNIDGSGILRARAKIARIGVMDYLENGMIITEMRFPEDVIEGKDSFSSQVVTLDHPEAMVHADNAAEYSKGLSGDVVDYEAGWLVTNITVTHADAVKAARTTHKQFSNGYWAELVDEVGTWVDEDGLIGDAGKEYKYDRVQKNIVGNHIALVKAARAGSGATFTDSMPFIIDQDEQLDNKSKKVNTMVQIIHNDKVLEIDGKDADAVANIVSDLKKDFTKEKNDSVDVLGEKEAQIVTLTKEKTELEAKADTLAEQVTEMKNAGLTPEWFDMELKTRVNLYGQIKQLDSAYELNGELDSKALEDILLDKQKEDLKEKLPNLADKIDAADKSYIVALQAVQGDLSPTIRDKQEFLDANKKTPVGDNAPAPTSDYLSSRMK